MKNYIFGYARVSTEQQNLDRQLDALRNRTREGLKSARAKGRTGGRPRTDPAAVEKALRLYDTKEYSIKEIETLTGVKKSTLYRHLHS